MKFEVMLSPQAVQDLREIVGYIAEDNPQAARELLAHLRKRILGLADMPHLGRPGRVPGTRELVIPDLTLIHNSLLLLSNRGKVQQFSLSSEGSKALPPLFSRGGLGWGLLFGL